jgi:NAD(P)-dependent dehydrogenase (short-subunit alcohol dehydrogenase family)
MDSKGIINSVFGVPRALIGVIHAGALPGTPGSHRQIAEIAEYAPLTNGAIQTDFSDGMVRDNPEINKRFAEMTALGRAGVPDDIGPMIAALLSEENRWVNGQRIEVSGGMAL